VRPTDAATGVADVRGRPNLKYDVLDEPAKEALKKCCSERSVVYNKRDGCLNPLTSLGRVCSNLLRMYKKVKMEFRFFIE
jgi:hypothetical protein